LILSNSAVSLKRIYQTGFTGFTGLKTNSDNHLRAGILSSSKCPLLIPPHPVDNIFELDSEVNACDPVQSQIDSRYTH
jgi:hypothetical protein